MTTSCRCEVHTYRSLNMSNEAAERCGKWKPEEESYAEILIDQFQKGVLDDCLDGCTLRSYLARKLACGKMRISKKYAGRLIGKCSYSSRFVCSTAACTSSLPQDGQTSPCYQPYATFTHAPSPSQQQMQDRLCSAKRQHNAYLDGTLCQGKTIASKKVRYPEPSDLASGLDLDTSLAVEAARRTESESAFRRAVGLSTSDINSSIDLLHSKKPTMAKTRPRSGSPRSKGGKLHPAHHYAVNTVCQEDAYDDQEFTTGVSTIARNYSFCEDSVCSELDVIYNELQAGKEATRQGQQGSGQQQWGGGCCADQSASYYSTADAAAGYSLDESITSVEPWVDAAGYENEGEDTGKDDLDGDCAGGEDFLGLKFDASTASETLPGRTASSWLNCTDCAMPPLQHYHQDSRLSRDCFRDAHDQSAVTVATPASIGSSHTPSSQTTADSRSPNSSSVSPYLLPIISSLPLSLSLGAAYSCPPQQVTPLQPGVAKDGASAAAPPSINNGVMLLSGPQTAVHFHDISTHNMMRLPALPPISRAISGSPSSPSTSSPSTPHSNAFTTPARRLPPQSPRAPRHGQQSPQLSGSGTSCGSDFAPSPPTLPMVKPVVTRRKQFMVNPPLRGAHDTSPPQWQQSAKRDALSSPLTGTHLSHAFASPTGSSQLRVNTAAEVKGALPCSPLPLSAALFTNAAKASLRPQHVYTEARGAGSGCEEGDELMWQDVLDTLGSYCDDNNKAAISAEGNLTVNSGCDTARFASP